jgi:uncharacterized protein (DUF302 family)
MRITRIWMTGCMALVLLAASRLPVRGESKDTDDRQRGRLSMNSQYDLDETVRQIERKAREAGLRLMLTQTLPDADLARSSGAAKARVLVFGDESGHTPIVQAGEGAPELPLRVVVAQHRDGRTEVSLASADALTEPESLPKEARATLRKWPQLLRAAISRA